MTALHVIGWLAGLAALAVIVKLFAWPWIPPLYARYKEFVQRKALGK